MRESSCRHGPKITHVLYYVSCARKKPNFSIYMVSIPVTFSTFIPPVPFFFCSSPSILMVIMTHSALSALVAFASLTYAAAQVNTYSTFPATPLVSIDYAYSSLVCIVFHFSAFSSYCRLEHLSRTKLLQIHTPVGPSLVTMNVILPPRISSQCARLLSSTTSLVPSVYFLSQTGANALLRFLHLCPRHSQFNHR